MRDRPPVEYLRLAVDTDLLAREIVELLRIRHRKRP